MLFWVLVGSLTIAALLPIVWPLLRARSQAAPDESLSPLVAVFRDRRREINTEREAGRLTALEAEAAQAELLDQMATELPPESLGQVEPDDQRPMAGAQTAMRIAALAIALLLPASAVLVYQSLGAPELASADPAEMSGTLDEARIKAMIEDLEKRVTTNPDDGEAWMMLGGARKFLGDHASAIQAFDRALQRVPPGARLLAELAESIAITQQGRFSGRPLALLEQALALDAEDPKGIALMGAAQFQAGNLAAARVHLKKLLDSMPQDRPEREELTGVLARIDAQIGQAGPQPGAAQPPVPAASGQPAPQAHAADVSQAGAISGRISVAPEFMARAGEARTLFVFARAPAGPRVPYAVLRIDNPTLPLDFTLDDALAMDSARRLSSAETVVIEARLSRSGNALRQPGDLFGESPSVKPGAKGLALRIDQEVHP